MARRLTTFSKLLINLLIIIVVLFYGRMFFSSNGGGNSSMFPLMNKSEKVSGDYQKDIQGFAQTISSNLNDSRKVNKILVADFINIDNSQDKFGGYLAEEFSSLLSSYGRNYQVLARPNRGITSTDLFQTARNLGADVTVTGEYKVSYSYLKLKIKVVHIESNDILLSEENKISIDKELSSTLRGK